MKTTLCFMKKEINIKRDFISLCSIINNVTFSFPASTFHLEISD